MRGPSTIEQPSPEQAGADVLALERAPSADSAPLVAIGGLLTIKRLSGFYAPLLRTDTSTDLPPKERFIAPPNKGIGEPTEIQKRFTEDLENMFERVGRRRIFLAGHSLGGLLGTVAAVERPDLVAGVASIAGAHSGYKRETPGTVALRSALGNPAEARHLKHDSSFMIEHHERMAEEWPEDVPLHIISTPADVLVVPPQGFDVQLPNGRQPEKRLVVSPAMDKAYRLILGIKDDVESLHTWRLAEHVGLPRIPVAIQYVDLSRRNIHLYGNQQQPEPDTVLPYPAAA